MFKFKSGTPYTLANEPEYIRHLKYGVWIYFFLIIIEGGLRKWILPGLATPLLILRDPVALWVMAKAYKHHMFPKNGYITILFFVTLISLLATLSLGHGNAGVALFGARILLVHFPFMFVIGRIFNRDDVIQLGKVLLIIAIPMTLLIALQFYSPQSALVNRGVGGDMAGAGFSGSGEYKRPSGTFSFTSGNVQFFQLVSAFVFYFFLDIKSISRLLLYIASFALILAIPLSISRALFFNLGIVLLFIVIAGTRKRKYIINILNIVFVAIILVMILSQTEVFKTSTGAFTDRFENANEAEGGVEGVFLDRVLGGLLVAFEYAANDPSIFGKGLGMGTNVGAKLLTGKTNYLISEGEWGRLVGEMGPLLGLIVVFIRIHFTIKLLGTTYSKIKTGDMLPWILFSVGSFTISQGLWAQPTALGFSTLIGGLIIASFNASNRTEEYS